ncbi:AraC family transcriptional regulator [Thaumasiovibrio subtropicus]|uniref:AraC family transcriptional regulator n=1 Tax=Thaumasiovibrio subtropicus TaxID=1891207 RepID=UPI000B35006F|nr:AraC family transcriptional regulator [Thaumasiovibrio subtropicus]
MDKVTHQVTDVSAINLIDAQFSEFAFKRHYHLDYHIGLITSGHQHYFYRGARHIAGPGHVVLLPPDEIHDGQAANHDGYQVKIFDIEPDWLHDQAGIDTRSLSFLAHNIDDKPLFAELGYLHGVLHDANFSNLGKDCLSWHAFSSLFDRYATRKSPTHHQLGSRSLGQIREFMDAHLSEKITLDELADLCQLSHTQLLRQFKKSTQMTPYAYLARLRLERAMQLIRRGERSTDVAHLVGFYDQAHFVKAFKQTFGITPGQLQR